jgi:hypothetical protein
LESSIHQQETTRRESVLKCSYTVASIISPMLLHNQSIYIKPAEEEEEEEEEEKEEEGSSQYERDVTN